MKFLNKLRLSFSSCFLVAVLSFCFISPTQAKTKNIYQQGNNPANFVRLVDTNPKDFQGSIPNQPYTLSEDQVADMLRSLLYNRRALFGDKVKTRVVFTEETIDKYTSYLVKAFQEATSEQMVYFSVAQNYNKMVLRDPKLTQVAMWISGNQLYMRFDKTQAKLFGDYQARTPEGQKMRENAKALRIALEAGPGQKFFSDSTQGLILDLNADWDDIATQVAAEQERVAKELELAKAKGSKKKKLEKQYKQEEKLERAASVKDQKNAEQRLKELKRLKDSGLINQEDYDIKKAEILRDL